MPDDNASSAEVTRVACPATRFVLFKVGQIRFALASTAIAAFGRERENECHYVAAQVLVPERYRAAAGCDAEHQHYIHLAGTRLGFGPCKSDGEIVALEGAVAPRNRRADEPWRIIHRAHCLVRLRLIVRDPTAIVPDCENSMSKTPQIR